MPELKEVSRNQRQIQFNYGNYRVILMFLHNGGEQWYAYKRMYDALHYLNKSFTSMDDVLDFVDNHILKEKVES